MAKSDSSRLDRLVASLQQLGRGQSTASLARRLGETALGLVDEGFERGRAPSGRRWPRPKQRRFRPMIRSGRLRRSFVLKLSERGFELISKMPYASILQRGSRGRLVPRKTLPDKSLSARWERLFRARAELWIREQVERPIKSVG